MSRTSPTREPVRSRALSLVLWAGVVVLAVVLQQLDDSPGAAVVVIAAAWLLIWAAKRLWTRSAAEVLADDARPPVLYLRSFQLDGAAEPIGHRFAKGGAAGGPLKPLAEFLDAGGALEAKVWGRTLEAAIVDQFKRIGPVIAIGRPGELAPEIGAARLYVSHDQWQSKVIELIEQAAVVVVQPTTSAAVFWEIREALSRREPERVVLLFFEMAMEQYAVVHEVAKREGLELPPPAERTRGESVVVFDADRRPCFFRATSSARSASQLPSLLDDLKPLVRDLAARVHQARTS